MKIARSAALLALLLSIVAPSAAQNPDPAKVELKVSSVAGGVSMIEGVNGFAGGNVGVSVGGDGMFIIDDESNEFRARVAKLVAAGKTLDQAIAAKPTADLDEKVGGGFITPAKIVEAAYKSLTRSKAKPAAH